MINRTLNVPIIDQQIISRGWTFSSAAARIRISKASLAKVYQGKNVNNRIILKIAETLDIPLERLVRWDTHGDDLQAR